MYKKVLVTIVILLLSLSLTSITFYDVSDEDVISFKDIKANSIMTGSRIESNWFYSGLIGTQCVVEISKDAPVTYEYMVGALCCGYIDPKIILSGKYKVSIGFSSDEIICTTSNVSNSVFNLLKVGAGIKSLDNVEISYGTSHTFGTEVNNFLYSNQNFNDEKEYYEFDMDTVDTTKENFALGYIVKCVKFHVIGSYMVQNLIFRGPTLLEDTLKLDYDVYVFTSIEKTWIYENGKFFGTKGDIKEIKR